MDVDIAKRLADRRRAAGLTQEELAEKLGVSRQAVSKWECSESSPDTDNLISLARLYDVSLDDLLYTDVERGGTGTACGEDAEEDAGGEPATDADAGEDDADGAGDADTSRKGDGTTHIGFDGIHVEDGKDYVHINWRDGVNVIDGKKGDHVHVGWDGVHINDREFDNLADANAYMGTGKRGSSFLRAWNRFPFPLVVLVAYISRPRVRRMGLWLVPNRRHTRLLRAGRTFRREAHRGVLLHALRGRRDLLVLLHGVRLQPAASRMGGVPDDPPRGLAYGCAVALVEEAPQMRQRL